MHWKLRPKEKIFSRKSPSSLKKRGCLGTMCVETQQMELLQCWSVIQDSSKVKDTNPDTKHLHCVIHRYALASKTLPTELRAVLDVVIAMVNAIKQVRRVQDCFGCCARTLMNSKRTCSTTLKCIDSQ